MPLVISKENMMEVLGKYLPEGETILAGVHGICSEARMRQIVGGCVNTGIWFEPSQNGKTYLVEMRKCCKFDLYLAVTENHLLVSQCKPNSWYYKITESAVAVEAITERLSHNAVGYRCYPLSDIESFSVKKAWGGAMKIAVALRGGSYFNIQLPKRCEAMPDHESSRSMIIERLNKK